MIRLAADENFNGRIFRGLLRRNPEVDLVRIQETRLVGAEDHRILEWTAQEGRVLLTHDLGTIPKYAYERMKDGHPMPGVIAISDTLPMQAVIEDLLLIVECSAEREWESQVIYLPL